MILIIALDDRNGMMFNNRRQSQDKILREKILSITEESKLWMNHYTYKQFAECSSAGTIVVDDDFTDKAQRGDYCFAENVLPDKSCVDKIFIFKWNRTYPGDFYFDWDISSWQLIESEDFVGSSHEKITLEVYVHE